MKKLFCLSLALILLLSVFCICGATAEAVDSGFDMASLDLKSFSDEDLEAFRVAIVSEQKSRIVSKISLDQESISLNKGTSAKLSADVLDVPDGVTAGKLAWSTSDKSIVTVQNGTIKAVGEGKATITCSSTLSDGTELTADCNVAVFVAAKTIAYKNKNATAQIGETYSQEVTFTPNDVTNKTLTFESSNTDIATVDSEGVVTIIAAGQVSIVATTTDGSEKSASYTLTIPSLKAPDTYSVTEKTGGSFEVEYYGVTPENVKMVNSSKNIADIEMSYDSGKFTLDVTPKTAGTTKVTLTDGKEKANQRVISVTVENSAVYSEKSYPKIKYEDAYRYPDSYEGQNVSFSGRVLQVVKKENRSWESVLRVSSRGRGDDVVYVTIDSSSITTPVLEDDTVTVYGTYDGNYTYETIMGKSVTIPSVDAERIDVKKSTPTPKKSSSKSSSSSQYMSDRELIEMAKGYFVLHGGSYDSISDAAIDHKGNTSYVTLAVNFHCYIVKVNRKTGLGLGMTKVF